MNIFKVSEKYVQIKLEFSPWANLRKHWNKVLTLMEGWFSPHFFQTSISPCKNGAGDHIFREFSWFIINSENPKILFVFSQCNDLEVEAAPPPSSNIQKPNPIRVKTTFTLLLGGTTPISIYSPYMLMPIIPFQHGKPWIGGEQAAFLVANQSFSYDPIDQRGTLVLDESWWGSLLISMCKTPLVLILVINLNW